MSTDELLLEVLKDSFDADTRAITPRPDLADTVTARLVRARRVRTGLAAGLAVAAASVAVAVGTGGEGGRTPVAHGRTAPGSTVASNATTAGFKDVQLASFRFTVPAAATVTKSCLPDSRHYLTGRVPVGEIFLLVHAPKGSEDMALDGACVGATIQFTKDPRPVVSTVETPGQRTVYLTGSQPGTQSGYVTLTARQSQNAAAAVGGSPGQYYEVFTLPSDTSQSVLIAGLRQYRPAG